MRLRSLSLITKISGDYNFYNSRCRQSFGFLTHQAADTCLTIKMLNS